MEITEVRIKLMEEPGERLKAFCSITFDNCFVIRDLKIIEGSSGPFVAMPSRKLTFHCPTCRTKNHLRAGHCNQCGNKLPSHQIPVDQDGRSKLYADIAHPINSSCREMLQQHVIDEYREEIIRAQQPGYVSRYEDLDIEASATDPAPAAEQTRVDAAHTPQPTPQGTRPPLKTTGPASSPPTSKPPPPAGGAFGAGIFPGG